MSTELALFDFDGTITVRDSTNDFIKYSCGYFKTAVGLVLLSPVLLAYAFRLLSSHRTKQLFFLFYFRNWDFARFQRLADEYCTSVIPTLVRKNALERMRWHQEQNHRVVIVSGACSNWLRCWCEEQGVELIATELEVSEGRLTGRLATPNCYGREKARRIAAVYDLNSFEHIHAYGDSGGDRAMLELADHRYFRCF